MVHATATLRQPVRPLLPATPTPRGWRLFGALLRISRMRQKPLASAKKGRRGPKATYPSMEDWATQIGVDGGTLLNLEFGRNTNPSFLTLHSIVNACYVTVILRDGDEFHSEPLTHDLINALVCERIPAIDPDSLREITQERLSQLRLSPTTKKAGLHLVADRNTSESDSFHKGSDMSDKRAVRNLVEAWLALPENNAVDFEAYVSVKVQELNLTLEPNIVPLSEERLLGIYRGELELEDPRDLFFFWTILKTSDNQDFFGFEAVRQALNLPEVTQEGYFRSHVNNSH